MIHKPVNFYYALLAIVVVAAPVALSLKRMAEDTIPAPLPEAPVSSNEWKAFVEYTNGVPNFSYNGQVIDPSCIDALIGFDEGIKGPVDLKTCAMAPKEGTITQNYAGYVTDEYTRDMSEPNFPDGIARGEASYKVVASKGNEYIIHSILNGGGTGYFSGLHRIKKLSDTLVFESSLTAGGDRCNGGIANPSIQNGMLTYDRNVTPVAIMLLSTGDESGDGYKKYPDLNDSAAGCFATAQYVYNLKTDTEEFTLLRDKLGGPVDTTYANKKEKCFDTLYNKRMEGEGIMDKPALAEFGKAVQEMCFKK